MALVKGVPDIVIYAGGAFAIYYFFIRSEDRYQLKATDVGRTRIRERVLAGGFSAPKWHKEKKLSEREKYLAATQGQRIKGQAGKGIKARFAGNW